jgi:hypothetical protein
VGVPSSASQAKLLEQRGVKVEKLIILQVDEAHAVSRSCGRLVDVRTGAVFHPTLDPPPADVTKSDLKPSFVKEEEVLGECRVFEVQRALLEQKFGARAVVVDGGGGKVGVVGAVEGALGYDEL